MPPVYTYDGSITARYILLSVLYAPPGGCKNPSVVTYAEASTLGTSLSASESYQKDTDVSVTAGGGILGSGTEITASYHYSRSTTNWEELEITKSVEKPVTVKNPCEDGIHHELDRFVLWLGPSMKVQASTNSKIVWGPDPDQFVDIAEVTVSDLRDPSSMPPDLEAKLRSYGLDETDFAEILKANPFSGGAMTVNPSARFEVIPMSFPYEPPRTEADQGLSFGYTMTGVQNEKHASTAEVSTKVGISFGAESSFGGLIKAKLKASQQWVMTAKNTTSDTTGIRESASLTIGMPSFGYAGPISIQVLFDTVYKTFAFVPFERVALNDAIHLVPPLTTDRIEDRADKVSLVATFYDRLLRGPRLGMSPSRIDDVIFDIPGSSVLARTPRI